MSEIVTAMKTANTPRTPVTMSDWARATNVEPTMFTATITRIRAVTKTLFHQPAASSPTKSEVA